MALDPVQLERWGTRLTVLADVLLTLAAEAAVEQQVRESREPNPEISLAARLNVLANYASLVGDSVVAYVAERSAAVPIGEVLRELAAISVVGNGILVVADAIAVLAAREVLAAAQAAGSGTSVPPGQRGGPA